MYKVIYLMGYRFSSSKCLTICLGLTFIMGCFLASLPIQFDLAALPKPVRHQISSEFPPKKRLALIVPFRDRFEELLEFVPHMHKFLNKQKIPFHIFIIQQADSNRFNRASLINVGFLLTRNDYDYIAMHDVDLLPMNDDLKYDYPDKAPIHISSPETHPKYHYDTFIGGILLIKNEHFELVNGMSNNYWGWGLEDDEFYVRLKDAGLNVNRPDNIKTGPEKTFKHLHNKMYRKRDMRKCYNQREVTRRRDRVTGLHDVSYVLTGQRQLTIDTLPLTVHNVQLICNVNVTPWCRCPEPQKPSKS
ncbi:beta-1,4-galactosyltransferase 7 [Amyelois transitella]|uniref:beta-1,4-galactosyltransferase 7 n=1 Tax=Amyelois transitella TaxID=680683 RepID=UPI0029901E1D|nr:beta-1,4-galactosyltransferase 7 [Amyelois transitella]